MILILQVHIAKTSFETQKLKILLQETHEKKNVLETPKYISLLE